jgi:hypothetical protein
MLYDSKRTYTGLTLFTPTEGEGAWLIDMMGRLVNHWKTGYQPGYDAQLLPNGNLLYAGKVANGPLADLDDAGGGILLEVDWDSNVVWEYKDPYLHHAFDRTKNGNTLVLKWVEMPSDIAARVKGGDPGTERNGVMWGDAIQEITPDGKVLWEWIAHEHLDPGVTPRCPACPRSIWTHANAVSELPDGNILASFMKINTIAIIDKKTGNIKWQWGPGNLPHQHSPNQLAHQHCPTMLDNGNILVFDNGMHPNGFSFGFSRVVEVSPKTNEIVWSYGGGAQTCEFYSSTLGSCQRLPNGNTLICEGTTGRVFEVNTSSELVWEFANNLPSYETYPAQTRSHMVCSAHRYGMDYSGLKRPVPLPMEQEFVPGAPVKEETTKARLELLGY